jgi:hypothetical protein
MSRVPGARVLVLTVVLLVTGIAAAPGAVPASDHSSTGLGATQLGDAGIEPDGVLLRADVEADGDARWTVEYRVRLNDENTTAAFESLRADVEANETAYTATFADRMRRTARAAENVTGREMTVRNVSVRVSRQQLPQEYGVVAYRFEWTGFAATAPEELAVGDALAGLFLDRQTTLVVAWPDGYASTAVDPTPDERRDDAVVWIGPTDFGAGQPSVTLSTTATPGAGEGAGGGTDGTGGDGGTDAAGAGLTSDGSANGGPAPLLVGGVAVVVAGAVAAFVWRRSRGGAGDRGAPGGGSESTPAEGPAPAGDAATDAAGADSTTTGADDPVAGEPWHDELLSNEERVLSLLEHNDGRMKQQAIAAELEWSDAKTSQVIGKMREADTVETFRLGRENVVSLPDRGLS